MKNRLLISSLVLLLLTLQPVAQAGDKEEIAALKGALQELSERLAALEAKTNASPVSVAAPASKNAPSADRVRINADVRYRHESINEQTKVARIRQRVRLRAGMVATVTDNTEIGFQIASGSDDPISANQTLGDSAGSKPVNLDLAYFRYMPAPGHTISGGKMKKPWHVPGGAGLIWDGDLNPEGLAWQYTQNGFFANVSGQWFEERSANADAIMYGAQAGIVSKLSDGAKVTAGAGYLDYSATMGQTPFFDGKGRGNTLDSNGNYANDFRILELFAEFSTTLGEMPFSVYSQWVRNGAASINDTAMLYGAKLGKASATGSWELGFNFRDVEADAVVATFAESDVAGGGTAIRGTRLNFGYAFNKKLKGSLNFIQSENGVGTTSERDYDRFQADFSLKY